MTKRRKRRGSSESDPLSGPVVFAAESIDWMQAEADGEAKGPRSVKIKAYTGGKVKLPGRITPVIFDLKGMTGNGEPIPLLLHHDQHEIAGHGIAEIATQTVKVAGSMSGGGSAAAEVQASAVNGFPWRASVGVNPTGPIRFLAANSTKRINGRLQSGPADIVQKSMLMEVSFVAIGADLNTTVSMAASAALNLEKENNMDPFEKWLKAQGINQDDLTDEAVVELQAAHKAKFPDKEDEGTAREAEAGKTEVSADPAVAMRASAAAELTRQADIAKICAGNHAEIQAEAVLKDWSKAETEVAVMRAERPKGPNIRPGQDRQTNGAVLQAAMCQTLRIAGYEKDFDDQTLQAAHSQYQGRIGIQQVLLQAASQNGYACQPGQRITAGNLREVLSYAAPAQLQAGGSSTFSLPEILSNVANKELLAGFTEEDQAWREVSTVKNVSDFKTVTSFRMLDDMTYEELPPDGIMKHAQLGEETFTRKVKTYAKMFALTRVDIINDDMGAFDDLRTRLGRGAARKFNDIFWARFINNSSFFTAGRGNFIDGATTTLLIDFVGLQLGIDAFDDLRSTAVPPAKTGKKIAGTPDILLVPPELDAVAQRIFAVVSPTKASEVNIYSGKYRVVKVSQLSDSTFTGWSATAWYLLRPKGILAPMVVSFLNGVAEPIVESADADFNRLGIQFRGYHDFGTDQAEWLSGIKSKGAA